ncbi:MAG: FAD-linked oxidase C-terminal domain-containing protein [Planctomycetota bacterium]|nr:FAD-linked oxidase C-terminal domain-containing protein [Planctomycetota bacterium]
MSSLTSLPVVAVKNAPPENSGALSDADRRSIAQELARSIEGEVRFGLHDRMLYATDASLYQVEPLGVVIPANTDDAARAARLCIERGLPILPRGGGTSLAGQCTNRAVVIDLSPNCRRILSLDSAARTVTVEPGITVDDLNDQIADSGLFFAPDPATSRHANIGGCIGNNAAGARSVRYGRTVESLIGIDAVLGDGARVRLERGAAAGDQRVRALTARVTDIVQRHAALIRERFPRTIRRNAGYSLDLILQQLERGGEGEVNLSHLVCGSEGTLALTLGATLRLHPKPKARGLAVVAFDTLDAAIEAVMPILETKPSAIELLDDLVVGLARANTEYRRYVELMPRPASGREMQAILYVEYFSDEGAADIEARFAALKSRFGASVASYTDATAMLNAWKLRKAGEPLLHGIPGDRKPLTFVEDNAVPVENLARFVREFREIVARKGTRAAFYAHASVGVLHVRPLLDLHSESDRALLREIAVEVADLARSLGGVMSGEHGDGRVRGPLLERFYGAELMNAMREVKAAFDPQGLFNPGNIVEPRAIETITQRLRIEPFPPGEKPAEGRRLPEFPKVQTYFDYADQHGFDGAVEMCNGAGVCRKKQGGTMCPSYQATLDERHSTRGRGNALRLAITGQFLSEGQPDQARWNDAETMRTLDLCLSCKACKTECPSNVDISRLKAEYVAQQHRAFGTPLKSQFFARVRDLNRLGSLTPGIANWVNGLGVTKWIAEKLLGIDRRRTLPPFSKRLMSLVKAAKGQAGDAQAKADAPRVAIFGDCFSMFSESGIGLATHRVLSALGYRVEVIDAGCCARPAISMGLLPEAIEEVDRTIARMRPWIEAPDVRAIVVLEPSCLSAFKDDWLRLRCESPIALRQKLAARAMLAEELVDRWWGEHPRGTDHVFARDDSRDVVLHGHCHQKALWGAESSARVLRKLCPERVKVLDTGCCGMAGSFGYTTERYDLSMKIGELGVLPAARAAASKGAVVLAPGTSCRHQIHDGAHVRAQHPMEFLASRLRDQPPG